MATQGALFGDFFDLVNSPWSGYRHPHGSELPIVRGGPWTLLSIITCVALFAKVIGPRYMRDRKAYDLRPYMLVYNGIMFGMNGIGCLVSLILADYGLNGWSCSRSDPTWTDLKTMAVVYLGYVYFMIKVLDLARFVFFVLRKRQGQASLLAIAHSGLITFLTHSGLYFYPGGIFCWLPVTNCLSDCMVYAYYIMSSAGPIMKENVSIKRYLVAAQLIHYAQLLVHAHRFIFIEQCAPFFVTALQAAYASLSLIFFTYHFSGLLFGKQSSQTSHPASRSRKIK